MQVDDEQWPAASHTVHPCRPRHSRDPCSGLFTEHVAQFIKMPTHQPAGNTYIDVDGASALYGAAEMLWTIACHVGIMRSMNCQHTHAKDCFPSRSSETTLVGWTWRSSPIHGDLCTDSDAVTRDSNLRPLVIKTLRAWTGCMHLHMALCCEPVTAFHRPRYSHRPVRCDV